MEEEQMIPQVDYIPYYPKIAKQYNLNILETLLYGFFYHFLSKNIDKQITATNEELAKIFNRSEPVISNAVNKLKKFALIECYYRTNNRDGGQERYISFPKISYSSFKQRTFENNKTPSFKQRTFENNKSLYNIYNNTKDIDNNTNIIKDNISDSIDNNKATFENNKTPLDKNEQIHSKIKMSLKDLEPELKKPVKKKLLLEGEMKLFEIYSSLIKGNFNEVSDSVVEGVPRCLKLFKEYYSDKALEKFKEAALNLLKSDFWDYLTKKDPTVSQPKKFFNQKFMENHLITQLDAESKVAIKPKWIGNKLNRENKFANDPDVIRARQKNDEVRKQILEKYKAKQLQEKNANR